MRPFLRRLLPLAVLPLLGAATPSPDPAAAPIAPLCHTDAKPSSDAPARTLLSGYGTGGFSITTANADAQAYFNNGMQLAHAFAHKAAISAFKRAEELDPTCAMCVWGEAWSRGPTINFGVDKASEQDLAALADKAAVLGVGASAKERALIRALQKRYHNGGGEGPGDEAFAESLDALARADPTDVEINDLAADAWLISAARKDHRKIARAVDILKSALERAPNDTGLIHFYIHATEMDGRGVEALSYAQRLEALAPAASHLVHMPSHTYFWAGWYRQAEASNLAAVEIDRSNARRLKTKDGVFGLTYHAHNVQFGEGAALMSGDADGGLRLANASLRDSPAPRPSELFPQIQQATAYVVYGRLGSTATVAPIAERSAKTPFLQVLWAYAQGEDAARRGDPEGVKGALKTIKDRAAAVGGYGAMTSKARAMTSIADLVLEGRLAMMDGRWRDAEEDFRRGANLQEAELGGLSDPPAWWYPVRRSLAAALLAEGRTDAARDQAEASLRRWPYDPLSLKILGEAEAARGRRETAQKDLALARAHWAGDLNAISLPLM